MPLTTPVAKDAEFGRHDMPTGTWVARFDDPHNLRPLLGKVKDAYVLAGELLLDIAIFSHTGERLGRISRAFDGPTTFEPACSAEHWEPIAAPNFAAMADQPSSYGTLLERRRARSSHAEALQWGRQATA